MQYTFIYTVNGEQREETAEKLGTIARKLSKLAAAGNKNVGVRFKTIGEKPQTVWI